MNEEVLAGRLEIKIMIKSEMEGGAVNEEVAAGDLRLDLCRVDFGAEVSTPGFR